MTWNKNMDDAPRDGREFLVSDGKSVHIAYRYSKGLWMQCYDGDSIPAQSKFNQWMPIEPPEVEG